ncbi:MAG: hypothetical protein JO246_16690 [Frankiaceae bacterium]|nr:hypothetical protein [Frankiaceae bacterium]MBV9871844.1 hypothetical protein [Frankiaceae bacterium]
MTGHEDAVQKAVDRLLGSLLEMGVADRQHGTTKLASIIVGARAAVAETLGDLAGVNVVSTFWDSLDQLASAVQAHVDAEVGGHHG